MNISVYQIREVQMKNLKKYVQTACELLELIAAGLMSVGILLSIFSIISDAGIFKALLSDPMEFCHYLEQIFMLIIGVEFLEMLCRPNSENVIEVLIFLVARHMIVGDTNPYQDFVSVISVSLLCIIRRYLRKDKERSERKEE